MVHFFRSSHSHSHARSPSPGPHSSSSYFRQAKHPESSTSSAPPCKLKIRFPHNRHIAFLYPDYIDNPEHVEVAMTVVEGVVDVELVAPPTQQHHTFLHEQDAPSMKARKVKSLYVELIGEQTLQFGQHNQKYETVHYKCEIVSTPNLATLSSSSPDRPTNTNVNTASSPAYTADQALLPGKTYSFPWSFIVYGNTAPYERIPGGIASTFHFVKAHLVLEGDDGPASVASLTTENASSEGSDGVVVEKTRNFTLVVNRNAYNAPPEGLEHNSITTSNDLGAVSLSYFSKYLIVSSYLWCSVSLPDLLDRPRVEVKSVMLVLSQFASWQNLEDAESEKIELPVLKYDFSLEKKQHKGKGRGRKHEATGVDEEEEEWEKQIRLPDEHHLRPSTSEKSITGIRVRHSLTVWITYKVPREGEKKRRIMRQKLERPVTIGACHTMRDNLELPAYSPSPSPMTSRPSSPTNLNTDNRSSFMTEQDEIECLCMRAARQSIQDRYGLTEADLGRLARERESRSASRAGSRAASRAASRNPSPAGDGEGRRKKESERDHP